MVENSDKRKPEPNFKRLYHPMGPRTLWCGKVQGLCDGTVCASCHLFPVSEDKMTVENDSTIDNPTLTDHEKIGFTADED